MLLTSKDAEEIGESCAACLLMCKSKWDNLIGLVKGYIQKILTVPTTPNVA